MEIRYTIEQEDIEWEMDWSGFKPDGTRKHPNKPDTEIIFEQDKALALLLLNEVIFTSNHWWEKDWPEGARKSTYLGVNCSDVFSWGSADSEEIKPKEIESLYKLYKKNAKWGSTIWCIIKRKEMPQAPVARHMEKDGVDLKALQEKHNIKNNYYDTYCKYESDVKYKHYCEFETSEGRSPVPKSNQNWWQSWAANCRSMTIDCLAIRKQVEAELGVSNETI